MLPDPSPLTQLPRDAPPTRPSLRRHQSGYCRGKDFWWFCWRTGHRPRPGRDVSRGSSGRLVAKQKPFLVGFLKRHSTYIERLIWSQETICFGLVLVPMEFNQKKRIPNLKQLVLLGYIIRRTPCVQMGTDYVVHPAILTKPSTHSYQVWNMTKLWLNTTRQN